MTRAASDSPPEAVAITSLRRRSDFDRVFRQGRRRQAGAIVAVVAPGIPGVTRLGLVAGRRVGGAVERNRAKRRLRHAMRMTAAPAGIDVVVIASPRVVSVPFDELVLWLTKAFDEEGRVRVD